MLSLLKSKQGKTSVFSIRYLNMETIHSLKDINFDTLFQAFNEAFQDYEMQLNKTELQTMLQRRGFVPELSFAAFNNDKIVSFTFNGIDEHNDVKTAYDTGTGTIKEFRGQGLASKVFLHSIPVLKKAGVKQYLLEVLQHNKTAVELYKRMGFKIVREFNYYVLDKDKIQIRTAELSSEFSMQTTTLEAIHQATSFLDFTPSWQNSLQAVQRKINDFLFLGTFHKNQLVGYCIFEPKSGDVTQIAVHKKYRQLGIATNLLSESIKNNQHHSIKIINTETDCISMNKFLQHNNIPMLGKQFEMIKQL